MVSLTRSNHRHFNAFSSQSRHILSKHNHFLFFPNHPSTSHSSPIHSLHSILHPFSPSHPFHHQNPPDFFHETLFEKKTKPSANRRITAITHGSGRIAKSECRRWKGGFTNSARAYGRTISRFGSHRTLLFSLRNE